MTDESAEFIITVPGALQIIGFGAKKKHDQIVKWKFVSSPNHESSLKINIYGQFNENTFVGFVEKHLDENLRKFVILVYTFDFR